MSRQDDHLTFAMLYALRTGRLSKDEFMVAALEHLSGICDECREEMEEFEATSKAGQGTWLTQQAWVALGARLEPARAVERRRERAADREVAILRKLPTWEARRRRVERARRWFRSGATASRLLDLVRGSLQADPFKAERWADLAVKIADRAENGAKAHLVALAHHANAHRNLGRLEDAARLFERCQEDLHRLHGEPYALAEITSLHASLFHDQGRNLAAIALLDKAVATYQGLGEASLAARCLVQLSLSLSEIGKDAEAVQAARDAMALPPGSPSEGERDKHLRLCAAHSLAFILCLTDSGHVEAREIYREHAHLYARFECPWVAGRRSWLLGRITAGEGDLESAAGHFQRAREIHGRELDAYNSAAVGLELALVYFRQKEVSRARSIAEDVVREFHHAEAADTETLAALTLFVRSVETEKVSEKIVRALVRKLTRSQPVRGLSPQ